MIEVFGKDGKTFRFQDGTSDEVIKTALDQHYQAADAAKAVDVASGVTPETQIGQAESVSAVQPEADVVQNPAPPVEPTAVQPPPVQPPPVQQAQIAPALVQAAPYQQPQVPPQQTYPQDNYYVTPPPPQKDKAMQYTLMAGAVAMGILAVTAVLWSTGFLGKKPETTQAPITPATTTAFQPTPQPDVRQALVATQVRKDPKTDALVLSEVVPGGRLDVLGERVIAGTSWLRVRLNPTSGGEGFVVASHLGPFGTAAPSLSVAPVDPNAPIAPNPVLPQTAQVPLPAPPAPPRTNGRPVAQRTYYVAAQQVNLRAAPSAKAGIVDRLSFGEAMTSISQYDTNAGPWLRVRADNGSVGWAKLSNLSLNPSVSPLEETMVPAERYVPDRLTSLTRSSYATRVTVGYYVQAGAARDDSEVQDVISRARAASSCVGNEPTVYMSDAFVKTKTRGMALIAYGPFSERYEADAFAAQLRPCIRDVFITHQPY